MTTPESSDDRLLREWLARETPPPLPDAGFTRRVLAALPPSRQRDWRGLAGIAAGAAIGLGWVAWNGGHLSNLIDTATGVADWAGGDPLLAFGVAIGALILFGAEGQGPDLVQEMDSPASGGTGAGDWRGGR